jgi:hypothetical protein
MKLKYVISILLALMGFVFWFLIQKINIITIRYHSPVEESSKNWWLLYGYLALLFGIFIGIWVRSLIGIKKNGEKNIAIGQFIKSSWKNIDLWIAIFVSPILFGTIIKASPLQSIQFLYFALQTGFSSYIVIQSFFGDKPTTQDKN